MPAKTHEEDAGWRHTTAEWLCKSC